GIAVAAIIALLSDRAKSLDNAGPVSTPTALTSTSTAKLDTAQIELPPLPEDPAELVNLGNEMLHRGYVDQAIKIYLETLKKNPEDEEVHFNLGFAYARRGMTNDAIKHYEE